LEKVYELFTLVGRRRKKTEFFRLNSGRAEHSGLTQVRRFTMPFYFDLALTFREKTRRQEKKGESDLACGRVQRCGIQSFDFKREPESQFDYSFKAGRKGT